MADGEDDTLILDQPIEVDEEHGDQPEPDPQGEGEDEVEIVFGDEAAPASGSDTQLVKHLRNQLREKSRELEDARKATSPQKIEVGEKPTLAGCEYDEEAYEQRLDQWKDRKAAAERAETDATKGNQQAQEAWNRDLQSYRDKRARLAFADVEEVEAVATSSLDQVQQAVIVKVAENPAQLLYALGKHPTKLDELSKITDPLKMAAAVAKLEGGLKVTTRRKAPEPEQVVSGNASPAAKDWQKTLDAAEKRAEKTGDRTEVVRLKARLKSQGKL